MKLSSRILSGILIILVAGLVASNLIFKKQYNAIDKSDIYWTYDKVLQQPFKYLNITGGNGTNICYEQSEKPSVRLLHEWVNLHGGTIKAGIKSDTLFINFDFKPANSFEKFWLENVVPVRVFSPQLLSVTGYNTNFEMQKLRQKSITIDMSGKSQFEIESLFPVMDSVNVTQQDSTSVVFEMSPDYKKSSSENEPQGKVELHNAAGVVVAYPTEQADFNGSMSIHTVIANIKDYSILNVGHAQIQNLQLQVQDSSAVVLSGNALKKIP